MRVFGFVSFAPRLALKCPVPVNHDSHCPPEQVNIFGRPTSQQSDRFRLSPPSQQSHSCFSQRLQPFSTTKGREQQAALPPLSFTVFPQSLPPGHASRAASAHTHLAGLSLGQPIEKRHFDAFASLIATNLQGYAWTPLRQRLLPASRPRARPSSAPASEHARTPRFPVYPSVSSVVRTASAASFRAKFKFHQASVVTLTRF